MKQFGLYLPRAPFLRTVLTCSPPRASMGTEVQLSSPLQHDHRSFQIVVASTRELGIGQAGRLPWPLPSDLKFFKTLTSFTTSPHTKNAVIMGRRTWDSLPPRFRPLPGRVNVILSRSLIKQGFSSDPGVIVSDSLSAALAMLATPPMSSDVERVFVIGGAQVYREAMSSSLCDAIHLTEIDASIECDTFMPPIDNCSFRPWYSSSPTVENGLRHCFTTYLRWDADSTTSGFSKHRAAKLLPQSLLMKHEEYQYLELVKDILETGVTKNDRTGTGVISKFGVQMRFNLRKSFPLLTTKRVFWRGVVEELLWLISGSTDARVLQRKGVHIWDSNASKEYLDSIGLHNHEEGDLGPVYGFQWRHFGAKYTNMHDDYSGKGFDQLADVIHKIRSNPDDRRIILSAWNPADIPEMALPPCHMFAQFYVANGELSCQMYQRSCDMGLGVPFNIASYALLTCLLAHVCDLVPGDFVHVLGDAHIYSNHVKALQAQLQNTPLPFPVLKLKSSKKDIDSFRVEDIELTGYECCGKIPMQMAV